jgi:hypothetical protein
LTLPAVILPLLESTTDSVRTSVFLSFLSALLSPALHELSLFSPQEIHMLERQRSLPLPLLFSLMASLFNLAKVRRTQ